jgi:predicted permease
MFQDLRYGVRMLIKTPGFTAIAVLSLALGIGANTAIFSVMDAVLLRKLPVTDPDRLVLFVSVSGPDFSPGSYTGNSQRDDSGRSIRTSFPYQSYKMFREHRGVLSDVFAFGNVSLNVNADGLADVANGQAVSGNYYQALGVQALIGRTITDEDDKAEASPAAVISHRYWQRRFGGDFGVVGKPVNLNNVAFTIIGVTPPGFDGTMQVGNSLDVSIPIAWEQQVSVERSRMTAGGMWWLRIMGRLNPGAAAEQARASLEPVFLESVLQHRAARQAAQAQSPGATPSQPLQPADYPALRMESGAQGEMNSRRFYSSSLFLLLGVVGLVLLIACANVANLLLSRAAARQKEIAVRLAMGARRSRLIRQLLTESVLLAAVGGALGVVFAVWLKGVLLSAGTGPGRAGTIDAQINLRVLAVTLALSSLTGVLFGIAPAWRSTRIDLAPTLKDSGRGSSTESRSLLSRSLVVAQVAMSVLLLIGAGLFLRSLINLQRVDPGFNPRNLLLFTVDPSLIGYKDERLKTLYNQISERLEAVPAVESVTFSRVALLAQSSSSRGFFLPGAAASAGGNVTPTGSVYIHQVRENFLETMGIPVLAGRGLTPRDDAQAPRVAVVNEAFARRYFPGESPVGQRFGFSPDKTGDVEVVGLVRDAKYTRQRDDVPVTAYLSWLQELRSVGAVTYEVRTTNDPASSVTAIRQAVREAEEGLPVNAVRTQLEQADQTLALERLFANLLTLFGLLAQQLASIGLYGVLAYAVSQRSREIGIRMALGADRRDVLRMILRQGMTLTIIGVLLGLVSAYVLTKYVVSITSMLYRVRSFDPLTFGVIAAFLALVALVACYIPARRATKVDPMVALRYE